MMEKKCNLEAKKIEENHKQQYIREMKIKKE